MWLKHAIEFDSTGSGGFSGAPAGPLRRRAFSIRRENGRARAVALSLLVHVGIGAALFCQLVPKQFIRMPGGDAGPKTLDVFLIAEPAGGGPGPAAPAKQTAAPVQAIRAAEPAPVVAAVKKLKPAVQEKKKPALTRQQQPEPMPAQTQDGQVSDGKAVSDTGSSQTGDSAGKSAVDGQPGAGSGGSGTYRETAFGQADSPRFLDYVQPQYPLAARQQGREGTVILRLTIDDKGNLMQVEVLASPSEGFAESAVNAVKRSKFAPAQSGGKAVAARAVLPVRFAIKH